MGNSSKYPGPPEAGVRLVTSMSITIMTVGSLTTTSSTYGIQNMGGFNIENISFYDSSFNGSAIGGLLMNGVSEAMISRCDFENFNGQQPGFAPSTTALSYGMKATAYGGSGLLFNNNIVLFHVKGQNNSVFYDASQGKQDGPIVIGGDIFPTNTKNSRPTNPPWNSMTWGSTCFGIMSSGSIRLSGTHFDVGADSTTTQACVGILTLAAGIISGKFESTPNTGTGIVMGGGSNSTVTITAANAVQRTAGTNYVTATKTGGFTGFTPGQVVNVASVNSTDQQNFDGSFVITSQTANSITYDYPGNGTLAQNSNTVTVSGIVSSLVKAEGLFSGLVNEVIINAGASNNTVFDMSTSYQGGSTARVQDNGSADTYQVSSFNAPFGSFANANLGSLSTSGDGITITDAPTNTGTGHLLNVATASGSTAKPVAFSSNGNGVEMSSAGVLGPIASGTGHITANNMLMFACLGTANSSAGGTINWLFPGGNSTVFATPAGVETPVPVTGTLKNLYVNAGGTAVNTAEIGVYLGGTLTSLKCSLTGGTSCVDTAHSVSVSAGNLISIRVLLTGTMAETLAHIRASVQVQ